MSTFDEQSLQIFYSRLFPYDLMFEWLSYSHDRTDALDAEKDFFYRREFSFTKAHDVYIRYLSFKDAAEFRERVKKDQPHKIDIGAVYSFPAKDHTTVSQSKFRPLYRELVFDVDLTDYEEVQTALPSGSSSSIWSNQAWLYMACAIKVVDAALREDFGFEHLLWVFSGRRGVHCWVCDEQALRLEDDERSAIVEYLTLITSAGKGGSSENDQQHLDQRVKTTMPPHPSVKRALDICRPLFKQCCIAETGQGILATEERWTKVLGMLPNIDGIRETLQEEWKSNQALTSEKRWAQLEATVKATAKKQTAAFNADRLLKALDSIVIFHIYPRLDVNVSTHRNHLLKSPFVVHPKTGNVCVPITNLARCEDFDPDAVPNLRTLIQELEAAGAATTSLTPILEKFESQFLGPLKKAARVQQRNKQEKLAAVTGAW